MELDKLYFKASELYGRWYIDIYKVKGNVYVGCFTLHGADSAKNRLSFEEEQELVVKVVDLFNATNKKRSKE